MNRQLDSPSNEAPAAPALVGSRNTEPLSTLWGRRTFLPLPRI